MMRAAILVLLLAPSQGRGLPQVPDGFETTELARGITGAAALTVAADGRIFVCEQTGTLRIVKGGKLLPHPFLSVEVDSYWERGLIGVALHPEFPHQPYVYVTYVSPTPYPHHRISRFTADGDRAVPGSEKILLKGDDQRTLGGAVKAGHQGGALHFGKDGRLYVAIGEQTAGRPSQNLDTFQGKILRLNPDGTIPLDNPFFNRAKGKYRAIWAIGLRNPYCFAIQPGSGRMFINDVGGSQWEEINEGIAGANYGWPHSEGPALRKKKKGPPFTPPFYAYRHTEGKSIAGGTFYNPPSASFPARYHGKFFFIDYMGNWIKTIDPDDPKKRERFASGFERPADLRVAPDGSLVVLIRNAWVKDDKFKPNTGSLVRIRYTGKKRAAVTAAAKPSRPALPVPRLVPDGGAFSGPVTVRLVTGGADARYTIDGSEPGPGAESYERPFLLDRSGDVVARVGGKTLRATFTIEGAASYGLPHRSPRARLNLPSTPQEDAPFLLSKTRLFTSLESLSPASGFVPYDVIAPQWADGAVKRRWISLPEGARIGYAPTGPWKFPDGAVLMEHLEIETGAKGARKRLETRVLVTGNGDGFGLAYRWTGNGRDAELVTDYDSEDFDVRTSRGVEERFWIYHSGTDCRSCHSPNAGFVLGVNARQLNRPMTYATTGVTDNQLRTWRYLQMFDQAPDEKAIASAPRMAPPFQEDAPLDRRVRSYLDVNCGGCHRPGGARAAFDARFELPLEKCNIVDGKLQTGNLEIEEARVVVPGDPSRSILLQRLKRLDTFRMPPLGRYHPDRRAIDLLERWISTLKGDASR